IFGFLLLLLVFNKVFLVSSTFLKDSSSSTTNGVDSDHSEDLEIDISQNATGIGLHSKIEFNITITNNGTAPMQDIAVDVSTTALNVELVPAIRHSIFNLEVESSFSFSTTASAIDKTTSSPVDLVLVVDASGSMGQEITSVQNELTTLINNLSAEIPDLKIGICIYGWNKHSEYPADSSGNYLELTNEFNDLKELINSLYASGGTEPWGDALSFINGWNWRETAQKLVIIVGDEDCDPGKIIGKDSGGSWYNGSELVSVVEDLKNKGIIISSVICEGPDEHVENQFKWISKFTEGKTVYLPELENGETPITLPELIQEWTLELSREYSNWFIVEARWSYDLATIYITTSKTHFWMDFSPPSIIFFEKIIPKGSGLFDVELSAEVIDFSEVASVILYHNGPGNWIFKSMEFEVETSLYSTTIRDLTQQYNLSFFIDAVDELGNSGKTSESWLLVDFQTKSLYEAVKVPISSNELLISLFDNPHDRAYLMFIGEELIENISLTLIKQNNSEKIIMTPDEDISIKTDDVSRFQRVLLFNLKKQQYLLNISIPEFPEKKSALEYVWLAPIYLDNTSVTNNMTQKIRTHLYQWTLNDTLNLVVDYTPTSDLVVFGEVYHTNWTFIGRFSVSEFVSLSDKTYFIIIHAVLREGSYSLLLTEEVPEITDRYYASATPSFSFILSL
ncbi:MAG: vWA domain-containing protein, partial [Candidatus Hodarchaeales archaeon]